MLGKSNCMHLATNNNQWKFWKHAWEKEETFTCERISLEKRTSRGGVSKGSYGVLGESLTNREKYHLASGPKGKRSKFDRVGF